jgi:hypothetical protein
MLSSRLLLRVEMKGDGAAIGALRGHLEGWPLGLGVVGAAALTAALAVPRPVEPQLVPPPIIDREQQQLELDVEWARAARAKAGLPLEVRSVGEAVRRLGAAARRNIPLSQLSAQLRRLVAVAVDRHGAERLLELRALQTELFVAALARRGDEGGGDHGELEELGGKFYTAAAARGWLPRSFDPREVEAAFRVHWAETLGLVQKHPYAPTLNEWRVYYRFLLSRPLGEGAARIRDVQLRLSYVAALAQHDQDYPARLARGVLLYQQGAFAEAAAELRAHLERHSDGPWALRARNYLAACGAALSP